MNSFNALSSLLTHPIYPQWMEGRHCIDGQAKWNDIKGTLQVQGTTQLFDSFEDATKAAKRKLRDMQAKTQFGEGCNWTIETEDESTVVGDDKTTAIYKIQQKVFFMVAMEEMVEVRGTSNITASVVINEMTSTTASERPKKSAKKIPPAKSIKKLGGAGPSGSGRRVIP